MKGRPPAIDIEHFAKVSLLGEIEAAGEDGHGIVEDFLDANPSVEKEIDRGKSSVYIDGLLTRWYRPLGSSQGPWSAGIR